MKPSDLDLLCSVSGPSVSPDGSHVVFSMTRPDVGADSYVGQLWRVPADGSAPAERLTRGFRDTSPVHSPDGSRIAFLRAGPTGPAQLHVVNASGGEPVAVTVQTLGVSEPGWSPDGRRLTFVSRVPEPGRYGTVEGISADAEPARRIRTARYLGNGVGYVVDRRAHVFVVDAPDVTAEPYVPPVPSVSEPTPAPAVPGSAPGLATPTQLTRGDTDHGHPRFTPDGRQVTFVAALHASRDTDLRAGGHAVTLEADGTAGEVTPLFTAAPDLRVEDVLVAPGGTTFALATDLGPDGLDFVGTNTALYAVDGLSSAPRLLTDPETTDLEGSRLVAAGDDAVLVQEVARGSVRVLRVDSAGEVGELTPGPVEVHEVAVAGEVVAVAFSDPTSVGDLGVLSGGELRRLTDFSAPVRRTGAVAAEELVVPARDGQDVHGWVLVPPGEGPHPVLLLIHGGPHAQYTGSLFDEAQVYAGAGYGVVMCNPRGSAGYGQEFGRSIRQRMGTVDLTDVLDFLDGALAAHAALDAGRLGILGGSYGGYLTAWTIAHDHRFAGAIVERGFLDPELFIGTSDIGTYFAQQYTGDDPAGRVAQSPQAVVGQVRTPTLVIHSEDDLRCPLSQAQRYHLGLLDAGVQTELLVFPGEDHELSRSGRPRHREQRFEAILDWWHRHLPVVQP
jgi:dipeptidyl aminopeptidase/acylaminoacyl peptidase